MPEQAKHLINLRTRHCLIVPNLSCVLPPYEKPSFLIAFLPRWTGHSTRHMGSGFGQSLYGPVLGAHP